MSAAGQHTDAAGSVLVVDDHELVGSLIVMSLCGRGIPADRCPVTTAEEIMTAVERVGDGLVLLDLDLGSGSGSADRPLDELALIREFGSRGWRTLIVSGATDERRVAAAVAAGAIGFVAKTVPLDRLLDTVVDAVAGRPVLRPEERARWIRVHRAASTDARKRRKRLDRLTPREGEILGMLARGERAAVIAEVAVVSLTTVRSQIRSILTKLEVNSQLEAAAMLRDDP